MLIKIIIAVAIGMLIGFILGWQAKKRRLGKRLDIFYDSMTAKAKRAANSGLTDAQREINDILNTAKKYLK